MFCMNKRNLFLSLNLLNSLISTLADDSFGIGTKVCFEGYPMDVFCISRGRLLDNPRVKTLENPEAHSVHCLIDVPICVNSGYEILGDPAQDGEPYFRAYRLDEEGNNGVVEYAKTVGVCADCYGEGSIVKGLRVTVQGEIIDLGDENTPPTIRTTFVGASEIGCEDFDSSVEQSSAPSVATTTPTSAQTSSLSTTPTNSPSLSPKTTTTTTTTTSDPTLVITTETPPPTPTQDPSSSPILWDENVDKQHLSGENAIENGNSSNLETAVPSITTSTDELVQQLTSVENASENRNSNIYDDNHKDAESAAPSLLRLEGFTVVGFVVSYFCFLCMYAQ